MYLIDKVLIYEAYIHEKINKKEQSYNNFKITCSSYVLSFTVRLC